MLLDGLPSLGSEFREAQRNAPEVVARLLNLPDDGSVQWHPAGPEWSLQDELAATVADRLGVLIAENRAKGTGKAPKYLPPFPRPVRALDLARSELEREYLAELEDEVTAAQARWRAQQQNEEVDDGR